MLRTYWLIALLMFLPSMSFAAQDALISGQKAPIYENPNEDSRVLEHRKAGEAVRVSTYHKEGWYKVRTRSGGYGWVWQSHLLLKPHATQIKHSGIDYRGLYHEKRRQSDRQWEPSVNFKMLGTYFPSYASEFSNIVGKKNTIYHGLGAAMELAFKVGTNARLAFRTGFYNSSTAINADSITAKIVSGGSSIGNVTLNGGNLTVEFSGVPFLVGLDTDLYKGSTTSFSAGFYVGASVNNRLSISSGDAKHLVSSASKLGYSGLINFGFKYWLSKGFGLVAELGGYFTTSSKTSIESSTLSSASQKIVLGDIPIKQLGPMVNVGLQFAF